MNRIRNHVASVSAITFGILAAAPAQAASLQQVSNWGASGVPTDISMYVYVPNNVATNPPILTLIHYCGGTASAVFGQASGIVQAADQYGFIMVVPSSGRCWDVESTKGLTRDGGGDSTAIRQMVKYAITTYKANADRVYSTGDSSGGMMTELLLALYPDVFKAGAAFAGMPAGCRAANETATGYSGACAGGNVTHTPLEWGDIVRNMDPGYTGHRPRVQLFHGDADTTIRYASFTEAIKEWTNVLGLSTTPTSTQTGLTLGTHQATRQSWQNSCGYVVLDAFTSIGGDHGPSDALFNATYVVPFLGLNKTGATDPEIAQCGSGGSSGTGGATSTGGTTAAGGARAGGTSSTGGNSAATGGSVGTGGNLATGGRPSTGGAAANGGASAPTGGGLGIGGNLATGGGISTGGRMASGGNPGTGGVLGIGGSTGGAASATGGNSSTVGTTSASGGSGAIAGSGNALGGNSTAIAGNSGVSETGGSSQGNSDNTGSCSCRVGSSKTAPSGLLALALGAVLVRRRRRKC